MKRCLLWRASFAKHFTSHRERSMRVPPWRQASQSAEGGTEELPTLESNQETAAAEKVSHRPGVTAPLHYQHKEPRSNSSSARLISAFIHTQADDMAFFKKKSVDGKFVCSKLS